MPTVKTVWGLGVVSSLLVTFSVRAADPAIPPVPPTPAELCRDSGGEERVCRSLQQFGRGSGHVCRYPGTPDEACTVLDGRHLSEAHIQAYEASWVHRALLLQRRLDETRPLRLGFAPATHNSFNSAAYLPTLSGLDHNQVYSLVDQLRMDMRSLELDVHWFPSLFGDPGDGGFAPILCHGQSEAVGPASVHLGCTLERHLRDGLQEIRDWLDDHPGELLLLYLENNLDGVEAAHNAAAKAIEDVIGDIVVRPLVTPDQPCASMPIERSRLDLVGVGPDRQSRVLIVGNCGPGTWRTWVHERDQQQNDQDQQFTWYESSSEPGDDYPDYPDCDATGGERADHGYNQHWIRYYEDSTWLTAMVGGEPRELTLADTHNMVRCGVNMLGFDQLVPEDPRLKEMIWSWEVNEPASDQGCARRGMDGHLHVEACSTMLPFACRDDDGAWTVAATSGAWSAGFTSCPDGSSFAVPATGYENALLAAAEVWVNYAAVGGKWMPNLPAGTTP